MRTIVEIFLILLTVWFAIAATMAVSSTYDNMDRNDIERRHMKEMWFLIWDHREEYRYAVVSLAGALFVAVFG